MTPAEVDTRRRFLGLSVEETAPLCNVADRTVRRWQSGANLIPNDVKDALDDLESRMIAEVETIRANASPPVTLKRSREGPVGDFPAGAHAMLIAWASVDLEIDGFAVRIEWA